MSKKTDFVTVTELAGEEISLEQLQRLNHRYVWAAQQAKDADVVEIACGSGPGLGLLGRQCRTLIAGDISEPVLERAKAHYDERFDIRQIDAEDLPFPDNSKDIIILFEAIYYLPNPEKFVRECARVLRQNGRVLIATANKDMSDFNASPYSRKYYGAMELKQLFAHQSMAVSIYGYMDVSHAGVIQRMLRPVKKMAVRFGLMPKTMAGKRLLKRIVFGRPIRMPAELDAEGFTFEEPIKLSTDRPNRIHKVLYCVAAR